MSINVIRWWDSLTDGVTGKQLYFFPYVSIQFLINLSSFAVSSNVRNRQDWVALMSQPYWVEVDWSWGWLKLRFIEVEVDWSWGCLKLRLIAVEVDSSWGWLKSSLIGVQVNEVEVDWSWGWLKLRLIKIDVDWSWG